MNSDQRPKTKDQRLKRKNNIETIQDVSERRSLVFGLRSLVFGPTGFTLIEILLVFVLIAVIAGISVPDLRARFQQSSLENTSRNAAQFLRYAQYRAIADRLPTGLSVEEDGNAYRVKQYRSENGETKAVALEGLWGRAVSMRAPITLDSRSEEIVYFPDGSTTGGVLILKSNDERAELRVKPGLGRLDVHIEHGKA